MNFLDERLPRSFWDKCVPEPNSGCWLWFGAQQTDGYGSIWINKRSYLAHRAAYVFLVGEVTHGLELDHLCRVRCCVNPAHLEPVTHRENVMRGGFVDVLLEPNRAKTHCPSGHPYAGENLYVYSDRRRACRECAKLATRRYRDRLRS